ncbi:Kelch repeat-containing protein [Hymenobacter properus]|uniref:T9SS type A sorting domain-containing protein n=1 Tax=Hymenobacter properus TaxID=2791026 RepID=A0A931FJK3_9BACT|nr:malectin domain-containing carbohydrate-binding protein [Hymenobacter properus]MBF9141988.1 T9SS type A sorting domain-containing protein [Hymenobacter properus]MBR7720795.1 T9SS type A sorting domain-containing protein [Microvirga sp. SRT04]
MLTLFTLLTSACLHPAANGDTVRIDCGSSQAYRTTDGRLFLADQYYTGGRPYANPAIVDIAGTADDALYRTERSGPPWLAPLRYDIPVPAGDYLVRVHLAEIYHGATNGGPGGSGRRVFSMRLEDQRVLINHDLNATAGPMTAVVKEYRATVTDGFASLEFVPMVDQPTVTAIEVLRQPAGSTPAPACAWTPRAASVLERKEGQCGLVGNQFYTFGGYYRGLLATNLTQRYDLAANTWATLTPMPLMATHTAAAVAGPTIWIMGGFVGNYPGVVTDAVQVYDTRTDTWRMGPPLPARRGAGAAALLGRQLHYFGGVEADIQTDSPMHYVLNLDNEAAGWQVAAPLPLPRCHLGGASVGGKIYALAGQHGHNISVTQTALVHEYDPLTNAWTRLRDFPTVRSHFEGTVTPLDGRLLTIGGQDDYTNREDVLSYDPGTDQWTELCRLPTMLGGAFATVLNNTLIVAQGEIEGALGPETATRTTPLARTPAYNLHFSRAQLSAQVVAGGQVAVRNLLWTPSGTANYTLSALPAWLTLAAGARTGTVDPSGQYVVLQADATGLAPGTYTATLQATAPGYAAASSTFTLTVTAPLATAVAASPALLRLFPNPAADQTTLQFTAPSTQLAQVEVHNGLGQLVWQGAHPAAPGDNRLALPTYLLAPGVYTVRLRLREGSTTARLVLAR